MSAPPQDPSSGGFYSLRMGERRPHRQPAPAEKLSRDTLLEGKYSIKEPIGEGGMGVVYEAKHVTLDVRVAVKVLQPQPDEAALMIERFKAEARSAASIRHRNIVEVTDFGLTPDRRPFFVMELLTGESLADRLEQRDTLSEREAVEIADQVLSALVVAHRRGVIHRDLKPENVFLARTDDGAEVVKLLDFGVAKIIGGVPEAPHGHGPGALPHPGGVSHRPLTMHGMVLGTPGYIAPETLLIDGTVDHRADLFSVGVLMFEMLTGRLPFRGASVDEIVDATLYKPVPAPRMLRPDLSRAMDRLVLTALAQEPVDRYQSATEFMRHLTAAAVGRIPEDARPCRTRVVIPIAGPVSSAPPPAGDPDDIPTMDVPAVAGPSSAPPRYSSAAPPLRTPLSSSPPRAADGSRARRPRLLLIAVAVLLIAAAAGGALVLLPGAGAAPPTGDAAPPTAAQELVTVWVEINPRGATLVWDGVVHGERPLVVPASRQPVAVEIRAPGYEPQQLQIRPDREQTLRARLVRAREPAAARRGDGSPVDAGR